MIISLVIIACTLAAAGAHAWVAWFVLIFISIYIAAYAWCESYTTPLIALFLTPNCPHQDLTCLHLTAQSFMVALPTPIAITSFTEDSKQPFLVMPSNLASLLYLRQDTVCLRMPIDAANKFLFHVQHSLRKISFFGASAFHKCRSWGPLAWLYPSEIQPLETRSAGQSLATMVNLTFSFVIGQT